MVGRKLKQHYRNTPYMAAWLLGRDTGKRRDDRYLFSALTNPDLITDWLQAMVARGLPVAGIYLLPMVSAALLDKLDVKATNLLLVAQHATGLRLTFFRDRQFRLSRLTRGDSGRAGEPRPLLRRGNLQHPALPARAAHHDARRAPHGAAGRPRRRAGGGGGGRRAREPEPRVRAPRPQELAGRLGIAEPLLDASPYAIYLHLLGLKAPLEQPRAGEHVTVGYKRYQARRAIYAACGALAAAAAVWTGTNLYQMMMLQRRHGGRGAPDGAARPPSTRRSRASFRRPRPPPRT